MLTMATTHSQFADWSRTPAAHFKLYLFAAVARLLRQVVATLGTYEETFEQFSFLIGYRDELAVIEPEDLVDEAAVRWWTTALREWEAKADVHLPLRALREEAGLDDDALTLLLCAGLVEEDARFGW